MSGVVEAIYIAAAGGVPMARVEAVEAVAHAGLRGDRYMERTGHWSGIDECQVTLIEAEALDEIAAETGIRVRGGEHRRNIVVRGVRLMELKGQRFTVGGAVLAYDRPRPPCRYIQERTEPGMTKALSRGRGGICVRVLQSGVIRVGDRVEVESAVGRGAEPA
jgi:MOSC domain-containing protein YiiM